MRRYLTPFALVALVGLLAGCGGGSGSPPASPGTSATFNFIWPAGRMSRVTRVFPDATQSIRVSIYSDAGHTALLTQILVASGQKSASVPNLPQGTLYYVVLALPNPDGTGTPLATASGQFTVPQTQPITVNLVATVDHLVVQAASGAANPVLAAGGQLSVIATPVDGAGNVVPLAPGNLTWSWASGQQGIASVSVPNNADPSVALVTAIAPGTATVTAHVKTAANDPNDAGASGNIAVKVAIVVEANPGQVTLMPGQYAALSATSVGGADPAVQWSILEAPAGGTITPDPADPTKAAYVAPSVPGTYHVVATSVDDPSASATVRVTVQSNGTQFQIQ
jgi:hypothetical protein